MSRRYTHVVIGGGFAGLSVVRQLLNHHHSDLDIVLVTPTSRFEYHAALYRSANGSSPLEVVIPYREIFQEHNDQFRIVQDLMVELRANIKEVVLMSGKTLHYDSLTLALGYSADYFGISGMADCSYTLYGMNDALRLRDALLTRLQTEALTSVAIIGAGPTGIEVAASLQHLFDLFSAQHSELSPRKAAVTLFEAAPRLLANYPDDFSMTIKQELIVNDIQLITDARITSASPGCIVLSDQTTHSFDVIIWTAGSRANAFFGLHPELFDISSKGRVHVNEQLHSMDPAIYIAGDSANVQFSGTAHSAIEQGVFIANDVIRTLTSHPSESFVSSTPALAIPTHHNKAAVLSEGTIISGDEGWRMRRQLDLDALRALMPEEVALKHWQLGEHIAKVLQ